MNIDFMHKRARIIQVIREFFIDRSFLEVDTPNLAPAIVPEPTIQVFSTRYEADGKASRTLYLLPSPELWMKRLLAVAHESIFQLARCFRNAEEASRLHQPEFLMLEWYEVDADYVDSANLTEELLSRLSPTEGPVVFRGPARRMTVAEAVSTTTAIDLAQCAEIGTFRQELRRRGFDYPDSDTWADLFTRFFLSEVEPNLPMDRPLFLFDYPAQIPCLAKAIPDTPWCERWELYIEGVELANCYTEETDPDKVAEFVERERDALETSGRAGQADLTFSKAFSGSYPRCSGTALGVDRLVMLLCGSDSVEDVVFFPFGSYHAGGKPQTS